MRTIATWVPKVDFAVLDDRIVPVRDVQRPIESLFGIDRTECNVWGFDQFGLLNRFVSRSILGDLETADSMGSKIVGDHGTTDRIRPVASRENLQPTVFRASGIQTGHETFCTDSRNKDTPLKSVVDPFPISPVGCEHLPIAIKVDAPWIDKSADHDFQAFGLGVESPDASAVEAFDAPRRFDVGVNVDRLVHVDPTVMAPSQGVEQVVGVLGTESCQNDFLFVGHKVAVGVPEIQQLVAVDHVGTGLIAIVGREHSGRDQKPVGKDDGPIGLTILVGVFKDDDFVIRRLTRLDLWIGLARGDPKPAVVIKVHVDGLGHRRIPCIKFRFPTFVDHEGGFLHLCIRNRDIFELSLSQCSDVEG